MRDPTTTQGYTDEVDLEELAMALERAWLIRKAQASPDPTTLETEHTDELERLRWRRRESNRRRIPRVDCYCRVMAILRRSSGEMRWSRSSAASAMSNWTQPMVPVKRLSSAV
jgi:hypothetical protein